MKRVLTIQDISCVGQCSITVALPIISACGIECCILPSAVLSTHTGGFKGFTFRDLTDDFRAIKKHWKVEKISFEAIYTGYLGSKKQIDLVTEFMDEVLNEGGLKIVDPAMADNGKLYTGFDIEYVKEMSKLCKRADIILPNITEAAFLTESECILHNHSKEYIDDLLLKLSKLGAKYIILKGVELEENKVGVIVYNTENNNKFIYNTDIVSGSSHGTGDCFAAAFTGAVMQGKTLEESASLAADFVVECLNKTIGDKEHWYGVKFEKALPLLVKELNVNN